MTKMIKLITAPLYSLVILMGFYVNYVKITNKTGAK